MSTTPTPWIQRQNALIDSEAINPYSDWLAALVRERLGYLRAKAEGAPLLAAAEAALALIEWWLTTVPKGLESNVGTQRQLAEHLRAAIKLAKEGTA